MLKNLNRPFIYLKFDIFINMRTVWIYTLSDPFTLEVKYVGKTVRVNRRLNDHLKCNGKSKKDAWIKSLVNKGSKPVLDVVEITDEENCNWLEQYWISQFRTWGFNLKNMTEGGDGSYGLTPWNKGLKGSFKHSDESKLKMSLSRKGKYLGESNPLFGRKMSPEVVEKLRLKRIGQKRSNEFKKNREGEKNANSKPVYCYTLDMTFVKEYKCARYVVEDGFDWNMVSKVCRGVHKTHKGYVFLFKKL